VINLYTFKNRSKIKKLLKALRIFTALLLIFFVLNYWSRKFLPFAYADVADYSLLYTTNNSLYIKKLGIVNDSLDILFNGLPQGSTVSWHYSRKEDGTDTGTFAVTGNRLRFKPPASKPQVLQVNGGGKLNISYNPGGSLEYEVTSADIPVEPAAVRNIYDWPPVDWKKDNRMEQSSVSRFVIDSAGVTNSDNTEQKILKIGRLVLAGMPPDSGKPSDSISALHPFDQYKAAKAGKANLWCGNYAAIFSCFAAAVDIPTRTVFTGTSKENLGLGNHVFCEAYLKEEDRWVYVDLTSNTILVQQAGKSMNVVDLQRLLRYPWTTQHLTAYSVINDSLQNVFFDSVSGNARYYFTPNTFFTFFYKDYFSKYSGAGLVQRIKNLFITRPMYAVYSDNLPGRNYHFLARVIANYLLAIAALLWFIVFSTWLAGKIRKRS
jgi:hypothetical protein